MIFGYYIKEMIKSIIGIYVNNQNNNFNNLIRRYNHSNVLFGSLLILIVGRNNI